MLMRKKPEVVVVGSGPGGLAAAMLLAADDQCNVTVIEARDDIGGRSSTLVKDGFRFDTGPTFFLYPRPLEEVFASWGLDLQTEIPMRRLDPQYNLVFGQGGELAVSPDPARMQAAIASLAPADAPALSRYLSDNRAKLAAFRPVLENPFSSWRDFLRPSVLASATRLRPWHSVDGDLSRYFADPRVRLAFSFQSKYLGMSPFRCPSLFTILSFLEHEYGVWHPIGGCHAVMDKMAQLLRQRGVTVRLGERVTGLDYTGKKITRVTTDKGSYAADAVVMNADFANTIRHLVPDRMRKTWTDRKLDKADYSCSTFMMYLGVKGLRNRPHHTIYLAKDYQRNIADIEAGRVTTEDPSIYIQNAGVTDSTLAPDGHSTLYVLVPTPHLRPDHDWAALTPVLRAAAFRQMAKAGFDIAPEDIVSETIVTPADWRDKFNVHLGATFNLAHSLDQMLCFRPHNRFEDVDGLYLVGGGTHPGSGLPVIFESALISARLLRQDLDLPPLPVSLRHNKTEQKVG